MVEMRKLNDRLGEKGVELMEEGFRRNGIGKNVLLY